MELFSWVDSNFGSKPEITTWKNSIIKLSKNFEKEIELMVEEQVSQVHEMRVANKFEVDKLNETIIQLDEKIRKIKVRDLSEQISELKIKVENPIKWFDFEIGQNKTNNTERVNYMRWFNESGNLFRNKSENIDKELKELSIKVNEDKKWKGHFLYTYAEDGIYAVIIIGLIIICLACRRYNLIAGIYACEYMIEIPIANAQPLDNLTNQVKWLWIGKVSAGPIESMIWTFGFYFLKIGLSILSVIVIIWLIRKMFSSKQIKVQVFEGVRRLNTGSKWYIRFSLFNNIYGLMEDKRQMISINKEITEVDINVNKLEVTMQNNLVIVEKGTLKIATPIYLRGWNRESVKIYEKSILGTINLPQVEWYFGKRPTEWMKKDGIYEISCRISENSAQ